MKAVKNNTINQLYRTIHIKYFDYYINCLP